MLSPLRSRQPLLPLLPLGLLLAMLLVLAIAGGASRGDVFGQIVVRGAAVVALVVMALGAERPTAGVPTAVALLLGAALLLVLLQLIPLPPGLWQALPERTMLVSPATAGPLWRPMSIEPSATGNAAASLLVPGTVLILAAGVRQRDMGPVVATILVLIATSAVIGVLQLAGRPAANPLVNDIPGAISALFANRNHFALFLAMGCLIAPVWAAADPKARAWRMLLALGLIAFFLMVILAGGSRAGLLLGAIGTALGLWLARRDAKRAVRWLPRRFRWPLGIGLAVGLVALGWLIVEFNRARSIDRLLALNTGEDMRTLALPTIMQMLKGWFPVGSGFGSFDTLFRAYEPFGLLKPTYFNHAHDDLLEIVITGGIPAALLLVAALLWWAVASWRVWRAPMSGRDLTGRLGSALLLLLIVASVFDYPARTPIMMALGVLAAVWLGRAAAGNERALPEQVRHL